MKPLKLRTQIILFAVFGVPAAIGLAESCAPKNTIGATCPTNAICDKVDFGLGAITVCLSPNDLEQVKAAATRSRAMMGQEPNIKKADAGLVF
jgi:hypothetical protein